MRSLRKAKLNENIEKIKYGYYVFDVETTKLEPMAKNFVFGVIYGYTYKKVIHSVDEFIEEFKKPMYKNKYIFAHNAEFDLLTIFGNIITELDNKAVFNNRFIVAKYEGITFGDSMNIYPTSVSKIGELLGVNKMENDKVKNEGLTKENVTDYDIDYCVRDCKIVFDALLRIFEDTGTIKLTLASLSMFQFRSRYLENDISFNERVDDFYDSYYGGRTEAFILGKVNAPVYDINSMYPYIMKTIYFPDIKNLKKETSIDLKYLKYLINFNEGMCKVTVRHKDTYFGYLPVRMKLNGSSERLVFPVGEFETTVNFNELRYALDSGVIEILKVHSVTYGVPTKSPFIKFIDDNYALRIAATDKLDKTIYKLRMNSLYGRFAMRMKKSTTYYDDIPFDIIQELDIDGKEYELKLFNEQRNDCYLITENEQMKASFFSIPTYSSYITSAARVLLLKNLVANENNKVCYCDTDSIALDGVFIGGVSDNLGDFKRETKIIKEVHGLKNYVYENENGETVTTIKGISKNAVKKENTENPTYEIKKYYKTKQSLRQNKETGESFIITKELKHKYDKRILLPGGLTKPIKL